MHSKAKAAAGTDLSKPNPFPSNNTTFWAIKYEHTGGMLRLDRRASNILKPYNFRLGEFKLKS